MKLASYIMEYMLLPPIAKNGALIPLGENVNVLLDLNIVIGVIKNIYGREKKAGSYCFMEKG